MIFMGHRLGAQHSLAKYLKTSDRNEFQGVVEGWNGVVVHIETVTKNKCRVQIVQEHELAHFLQ